MSSIKKFAGEKQGQRYQRDANLMLSNIQESVKLLKSLPFAEDLEEEDRIEIGDILEEASRKLAKLKNDLEKSTYLAQ